MYKLGVIKSIENPPQVGEHGNRRTTVSIRRLNDIRISGNTLIAHVYG